ncbi:6-phosphofructokinase [Caproiciproducens sp. NJN-50]|uniref:6-phosphofructokinase n=1 Tax=Acutalibacteraceae TaxID=3082771 RepID=UPI000FFDFB9E|nr:MULTISPECIES: ATP-dependent 6-phosphofructokinase [Acutalibacteraceae]QAT49641.1 6-phosphofructokinase [Caproiciproducens sp. NJN-50]
MKKIGLLTSGGDCQGLNAALRGIAKSLYARMGASVEIIGIQDGYRGLIEGNCRRMAADDFSGILTLGGTVLGTSRQPFKQIRSGSEDQVKNMKSNYNNWGLDCLVILGGNGTHKTANLLREEGLNIVTLPKTIDNDLWGTDMSFGFQSAVENAAYVIDCIHTTATSHSRVFIVEVMGHKAGWLTLHAGIAGGADVILLPEIPYNIDCVAESLRGRSRQGKRFSILAVAEGAVSTDESRLSKKQFKAERAKMSHPSISYRLADEIEKMTGHETRVTVPGHFQRGGSPCPYDRILATRFGAAAADLIIKEKYGCMVSLKNDSIVSVPLENVAGKLKSVPQDCDLIKTAQNIGISFGY